MSQEIYFGEQQMYMFESFIERFEITVDKLCDIINKLNEQKEK